LFPENLHGWSAYPLGVAWALGQFGADLGAMTGFEIYIDSDVPIGAGLSSSAAIESAVAVALNDIWDLGLDRRTLAKVGQLAENRAVGPQSSIDKLLFATAEKDINDFILDVRREWMVAGVGSDSGSGSAKELDAARAKWWYTRAATIMGGSAEVQRGIIADHILGLPKEKR